MEAVRDQDLPVLWSAAVRRDEVAAELEGVYGYISAATEARRPVCRTSGRCCRFEEWGHRLYVTGLEAAYTLAHLPAPLTPAVLDAARVRGGCPFQIERLCSVHAIRPFACRVYFCDETSTEWQRDLYERMQREVRAIHDRHAIEYRYAEWRELLGLFVGHAAPAASPDPDPTAPSSR